MTKTLPKLVLSASRDIPFSQLVLSQKNVRRVKAGLSIEDLAEDIYRRTLLQSINVRPLLDADGKETGMFEVPAGGRRFRALELLVKTKRMAKDQPVPCVVREAGIAGKDGSGGWQDESGASRWGVGPQNCAIFTASRPAPWLAPVSIIVAIPPFNEPAAVSHRLTS